ncbi:MAG: ABC transporter ATP-binding protein [Butyricicoccus sp.]|nr:ABC transporter ATP-binding protein [Butyricicoccus sp.]
MTETGLEIQGICKSFRAENNAVVQALDALSFEVPPGTVTALLGPSGCGKSTLLNLIAGFDAPDAGTITFDGCSLDGKWGMVFQAPALFDWLTVAQNVEFGLKRQKQPHAERVRLVSEILEQVGLTAFASAYPDELSGGMQQRVAIARALVLRPQILLMDEPFAALDAQLREKMQELLLELQRQTRQTILFVTHDIEEALRIASQVVILSARPGRVRETVLLPSDADARAAYRAHIRAALAQ